MHPDTIPVLMVAILTHLPRLFGWWMERRSDCNRLYNTHALSRVRCIVIQAIQAIQRYTAYTVIQLYSAIQYTAYTTPLSPSQTLTYPH